jgi:hypothetical protein
MIDIFALDNENTFRKYSNDDIPITQVPFCKAASYDFYIPKLSLGNGVCF